MNKVTTAEQTAGLSTTTYRVKEHSDVTKWDWEPEGNWVEKYTTTKTFRQVFLTWEEACEFIDKKEKRVPRPRNGSCTRYCNYEIEEMEEALKS